ncbi:NAD(P)-binding protein, partial [Wilcoxina mikolae CBS 423.85]
TDFYVLVTGANSGLGLSIVKRLVTDFLRNYPSSQTITIIFTTRSTKKSTATLTQLLTHLSRQGPSANLRIRFSTSQVDLTDLRSVTALSQHLKNTIPKLDAAIFNAGMGAFTGISWLACFSALARNWVDAVTHPAYKLQDVGWMAHKTDGEGIGEVFCANVFGHYYLAHEVMGLLRKGAGRIVWVSSLEAYQWAYDMEDIEGRRSKFSYESSKRITDVLALTSSLAATKPWAESFFRVEGEEEEGRGNVKTYVCHPGVCATAMIDLLPILWYCMTLSFYIARWLGSPWHTISTHTGANSPVHLALAREEELAEGTAERVKWGSGSDRAGNEVLIPTEVEGEGGEKWEELGRETWKQLEELRVAWKATLQ